MVCFDGPDAGKGFVILVNGDNPAVYLQSDLAILLLMSKSLHDITIPTILFISYDV